MNPIEEALAKGRPALNEHEAKRFLAGFGVPVSREILAPDPGAVAAAAAAIGFPVVLKVSGATLFHKTELQGVALNLREDLSGEPEGRRDPGSSGHAVHRGLAGWRGSRRRHPPRRSHAEGVAGFIAQTGNFATHTMKYILSGEHFGVCRVIGPGNKVDIDETRCWSTWRTMRRRPPSSGSGNTAT